MSEKVIFADFANNDLVEFRYNIDPWDSTLSSIELVSHDRSGMFKSFKFEGVSNLEIEKGFSGYLGGTAIIDISGRQWAHAQIEVHNYESGSGISFLAMSFSVSEVSLCAKGNYETISF